MEKLALLALALCCITVGGQRAKIYFTYQYADEGIMLRGVQVIYKPRDVGRDKFYDYGKQAYILFKVSTNLQQANEYYQSSLKSGTDWEKLVWDSVGGYYTYTSGVPTIKPNRYVAYGVVIKALNETIIYEDLHSKTYKVPRNIKFCNFDREFWNTRMCSAVYGLDPLIKYESSTTERTRVSNGLSASIIGIAVAAVILSMVAIFGIAACAVYLDKRSKRRQRAQQTIGSHQGSDIQGQQPNSSQSTSFSIPANRQHLDPPAYNDLQNKCPPTNLPDSSQADDSKHIDTSVNIDTLPSYSIVVSAEWPHKIQDSTEVKIE